MEDSRQQLSVLLAQQDELKGLLSRLLEGLEAAGLSTPLEASNSIKTLNQTVSTPHHTVHATTFPLPPGLRGTVAKSQRQIAHGAERLCVLTVAACVCSG